MATIAEVAEDAAGSTWRSPGHPSTSASSSSATSNRPWWRPAFAAPLPTPTGRSPGSSTRPPCGMVVPHLEGDESGALNLFLERAPAAVPVASPIGVATNLSDFAIREPLAVDGDTTWTSASTGSAS